MLQSHTRFLSTTAICALTAASVFATAGTAQAQREITTGVDEITVTAQKREENRQDIPVSVSALDADAIEKTFARDIQDVESLSPNLVIDPILGNGTAAISIRGMQLNDVEKSFDPAVAVYLDGVYLATTTGALLQIWDAESVEVLRGPQGTLFGRNTIGGLLHVRRKRPSGELGGRLTVTTGSFDRIDANARIDFPALFNDTLSTKVTVMSQNGGGYFDNVVRGEDEGDTEFFGINAQALWEPTDMFEMLVSFDYFDDTTPTRPVTALTQPGEAFCVPGVFDCGAPPQDEDFHRNTTTTFSQDAFVETFAVTVQPRLDINDDHSIQGVFGWRDTDEEAIQEFDGVESDIFATQRPQTMEQLSAELRWHGDWLDGAVQSVLGGFYWDSSYELNQRTTSPVFFGVPMMTGDIVGTRPDFKQETEAYAVFGQVDWNVTDFITITAGGRWLREEKTACGTQAFDLLNIGITTVASYGADGFFLCDSADPFYLANSVNPLTGETFVQDGNDSWDAFTPRAGITYRFDQGIAYFTYSEGFRSGGFNGRSTDAFSLGPYEPEEVKSYEFGFKTQWADNRIQLNATGFITDYQDKQEDVVFSDPVAVTVTVVQNAASASINGAEFEFVAIPVDGLTFSGSVGYLDASYDDWTVPGLDGNPVDKSDFLLRRAPEWTFALNGLYEYQLANGDFLVFTANYSWRDDYSIVANSVNTQPGQPGFNPSYGLLDLSVNYETERWRVSAFGKNVTGADYFLHTLDVGANYNAVSATDPTPVYLPGLWTFGTINAPATWGLELDVKF